MVKKDSGEKIRINTDDLEDRQYLSLKEYNPPVVNYLN